MSLKEKASKSSKKARLRAARLAAVQALYQMGQNDQSAEDVIVEFKNYRAGKPVDSADMIVPDGTLMSSVLRGVEERASDLNEVIDSYTLSRNAEGEATSKPLKESLLRAILLCASYELMAHHETDAPIIISDYLEVTHAFYDGNESKIVNAVLDKVAKNLRDS